MSTPTELVRTLVEAHDTLTDAQVALQKASTDDARLPHPWTIEECRNWLAGYDYAVATRPAPDAVQYATRYAVLYDDGSLVSEPTEAETLRHYHQHGGTLVLMSAHLTSVDRDGITPTGN